MHDTQRIIMCMREKFRGYMRMSHTVCLLCDVAFFGKREENLLRGWLGHGAFEVGRDVDCAVWTVYLFGPVSVAINAHVWLYAANAFDVIKDFVLRFRRGSSNRVHRVVYTQRTVLTFQYFDVHICFCLGCHRSLG